MIEEPEVQFSMHLMDGSLMVPIREDPDEEYLRGLQISVMERQKRKHVREVVFDMSAVRVMDDVEFSILRDAARMISMMGAGAVLIGIRPGVAISLVEMGVDLDGVETAVTIEDGLDLLRSHGEEETPDENDGRSPHEDL